MWDNVNMIINKKRQHRQIASKRQNLWATTLNIKCDQQILRGVTAELASNLPKTNHRPSSRMDRKKKSFRFIRVNEVVLLFESIDTQPKNCQFGLDKVNTSLLSSTAPIIYSPLTYVINLSLKQGRFPDSLQITKVIQIFRQGPLFLCNNYRPI